MAKAVGSSGWGCYLTSCFTSSVTKTATKVSSVCSSLWAKTNRGFFIPALKDEIGSALVMGFKTLLPNDTLVRVTFLAAGASLYQYSAGKPGELNKLLLSAGEGMLQSWFVFTKDAGIFGWAETLSTGALAFGGSMLVMGFHPNEKSSLGDLINKTIFVGAGYFFGGPAGMMAGKVVHHMCKRYIKSL